MGDTNMKFGVQNVNMKSKRKRASLLVNNMKNMGNNPKQLRKELNEGLASIVQFSMSEGSKKKKKKNKELIVKKPSLPIANEQTKSDESSKKAIKLGKSYLDSFFAHYAASDNSNNNTITPSNLSFFPYSKLRRNACKIISKTPVYESAPPGPDTAQPDNSRKKKKSPKPVPKALHPEEEGVCFENISEATNRFRVRMEPGARVHLEGQLKVRVLDGKLSVLGWEMTPESEWRSIYSPASSSLLCLEAMRQKDLPETECVVELEKLESVLPAFVMRQARIQLYRGPAETRGERHEVMLACRFDSNQEKVKWLETTPEVEQVAEDILADNVCPRVMACGGQCVGKSTLLRYLVNRMLSRHAQVLYIDLDPGQTEFTVPGCLSVVKVQEPLLGPSFTHLRAPERMVYLGEVSVSECPERYIACMNHLMEYCNSQPELCDMPWFINTMGFNKGLGVDLTVNAVRLVQPTLLVELLSQNPKKNFPRRLSAETVGSHRGDWAGESSKTQTFQYRELASRAEVDEAIPLWGAAAVDTRNIRVLAYLTPLVNPPSYSLLDAPPYKISLNHLTLAVCHMSLNYWQYLNAMNGKLVSLCVVNDDDDVNLLRPDDLTLPRMLTEPPVAPCLGFGIVRGVDIPGRALYLTTPLSTTWLESVNCLVLGSVSLPESVYTEASGVRGRLVPYLAKGPGQVTSQWAKPFGLFPSAAREA